MESITRILQSGGIGVLATDTLYGVVGQALKPDTVERIYRVKGRRPDKPFIILISAYDDLEKFGVTLSPDMRRRLGEYWPGPVSIILPCPREEFAYLHRGTRSLAFRMPAKEPLRDLIARTGPLAAPSANPEGLTPAPDLDQARAYFDDRVDFYQQGETSGQPSRLIEIIGDEIRVLRG